MKLTIKHISDTITIDSTLYHDIHGNLYLKIEDKYFVLLISVNDDLEWIEINDYNSLVKVNAKIEYTQIKNTYEKNSLKGKIVKDLEDENYDEDEDEIENEGHFVNKYKSYPEDKLYTTEFKEDVNDDEDIDIYDIPMYNFSKFGDSSIIKCLDRTLNSPSNYDSFVMNGNTSYVLSALQSKEKSSYRVSVFVTGKILLNIVGSKLKAFDLQFDVNQENEMIITSKLIKTNVVLN
jgi:hypothetical protein